MDVAQLVITFLLAVIGLNLAHSYRRQQRLRIAERRLDAYAKLWELTEVARSTRITNVSVDRQGPLRPEEARELYQQMLHWYFGSGGEVEVQPVQHRTATRRDPISGERMPHQVFVRAAIRVPACSEHQHIRAGQPAPVAVPRQRTARGVEQLGMFPDSGGERLRNAIYRETGR